MPKADNIFFYNRRPFVIQLLWAIVKVYLLVVNLSSRSKTVSWSPLEGINSSPQGSNNHSCHHYLVQQHLYVCLHGNAWLLRQFICLWKTAVHISRETNKQTQQINAIIIIWRNILTSSDILVFRIAERKTATNLSIHLQFSKSRINSKKNY